MLLRFDPLHKYSTVERQHWNCKKNKNSWIFEKKHSELLDVKPGPNFCSCKNAKYLLFLFLSCLTCFWYFFFQNQIKSETITHNSKILISVHPSLPRWTLWFFSFPCFPFSLFYFVFPSCLCFFDGTSLILVSTELFSWSRSLLVHCP